MRFKTISSVKIKKKNFYTIYNYLRFNKNKFFNKKAEVFSEAKYLVLLKNLNIKTDMTFFEFCKLVLKNDKTIVFGEFLVKKENNLRLFV